jgi:hypothetical protein
VLISSDDNTHYTEELDGKYDSNHDSDIDHSLEDNVDGPYGVALDGIVDMEWDGDDEEEED